MTRRSVAPRAARLRGFTLLEMTLAVSVMLILATIVYPSYAWRLVQARRSDAVAALQRVQGAQELYRAHHGRYAPSLDGLLGTAPLSPRAHYEIRIDQAEGDAYQASASARESGLQGRDAECLRLTLSVRFGLAEYGPAPRCWSQ